MQRKFGRLTLQLEISKDLFLVSHAKPTDTSGHNFWNAEDIPNVNIAVAASIPAYARTIMNYYLANPNLIIGYMDTDCIVIYELIPVSNELGKYKLEARYKTVIFLGPKSYAPPKGRGV